MPQLPADCLKDIFEYLYKDKDYATLHSCLLVNRLWCKTSVRILWRGDLNYRDWKYYNTLISCLPNKSKKILCKNGIMISTPTSKPPTFNYAAFCEDLLIEQVYCKITQLLQNQQSAFSQSLENSVNIVTREIFKMFMNQNSLRKFCFHMETEIRFTSYPRAKEWFKNLSELICDSTDLYPGFFHWLSQTCHNIQSIFISVRYKIPISLIYLIYSQNNLKRLSLSEYHGNNVSINMILLLAKLHNTFITLKINEARHIRRHKKCKKYKNIHELVLSFYDEDSEIIEDDLRGLKYITFPQLEILRFMYKLPSARLLINFLRNNGKNLKELDVGEEDKLNPTIADFCPNLKRLSTSISYHDDLGILKEIFKNCQYLENLKVIGKSKCLNGLLKIVSEHSPKNFCKLLFEYSDDDDDDESVELLPEELESFFINWSKNVLEKSLSFFIATKSMINGIDKNEENMKIIENYIELGIIKNFKIYYENPLEKIFRYFNYNSRNTLESFREFETTFP